MCRYCPLLFQPPTICHALFPAAFIFSNGPQHPIKITGQRAYATNDLFKTKNLNFEQLGIGEWMSVSQVKGCAQQSYLEPLLLMLRGGHCMHYCTCTSDQLTSMAGHEHGWCISLNTSQ
jgi:hypothetical protein